MMNMNVRTSYDILHVSRKATLEEAKEAYKRLVKLWHPDQYGNLPEKQKIAQEKLKEINVAYRDIVAIIKNSPVETESTVGEKGKQRYQDENPENENRKKTAFWNIITKYITNNICRLVRSEDPEQNTRLSPGTPRGHHAASVGGRAGVAPDFQQIFKRAVQEKRFGAGIRQRQMKRKRIRGQFGNAASYRIKSINRRTHGDRVEKITPVRRVNRIGGD